MKKLILLSAIVLCIGGVAFAAAVKVDLEDVKKIGASGQVIVNYAEGAGKTEIQVNCKGLMAGQKYIITVHTSKGYAEVLEVAKKNGTIATHIKKKGDWTPKLTIKIYRGKVSSKTLVLAGRP